MSSPPLPGQPDDTGALGQLARDERQFQRFLSLVAQSVTAHRCIRLILAKPRATAGDMHKLTARPVTVRGQACLSLVHHHRTKDITKNPPVAEGLEALALLLDPGAGGSFSHAHLFTTEGDWQLLISKRGKVGLVSSGTPGQGAEPSAAPAEGHGNAHDRTKHRLLSLEEPFLQDLGVTDERHRLVPAMARKWKQINKFVEVLSHALDEARLSPPPGPDGQAGTVNVVDFGAGKGYLTFATYQHLTQARGWRAQVSGVELREDLVTQCDAAARRRQLDGLHFVCGDVRSHVPERLDVMIALHACDTATDFALATAVRARAAIILSAPCCHKQIRPQMQLPPLLKPMLQHGIHLGQQAEMLTDSLRALLLEAQGYDTQVFEFVALEHTSKNKMILAVRRARPRHDEAAHRARVLQQVAEIKAFYGITEHALEPLLAPAAAA
ncbi:class I SAM-dependent methyltransferase [Ideonella livida]|uniref:SAM-dependent methyltransferase n=1 Tax=Ideonella livida TaxID=2707176 RepID=A0A7C9PJE1_9BURK|nr:SAM-dependent methyltransferase [Ideonella livida]NDY93368.1 SAM-dependent methyltransferase [Ideonella livida]